MNVVIDVPTQIYKSSVPLPPSLGKTHRFHPGAIKNTNVISGRPNIWKHKEGLSWGFFFILP